MRVEAPIKVDRKTKRLAKRLTGGEIAVINHMDIDEVAANSLVEGKVKLVINGITKRYYIAVLSSPAGNFRWCYLYDNCKKEIFLDSHVRFFKMLGGIYKEVVYDNMRNVVTKFIGKNEKELNEDLVKMSIYGVRIDI